MHALELTDTQLAVRGWIIGDGPEWESDAISLDRLTSKGRNSDPHDP
jgi:hypothetical protein